MTKASTYLLLVLLFCSASAKAQTITDSAGRVVVPAESISVNADTTNEISPRKAAIRSAFIPGWGQVSVRKDLDASFFRKYYSIPIIYGAIGTSAAMFAYNITWYRRTRYAYRVLVDKDTANFGNVHPTLKFLIDRNNRGALENARNEYRRDVDYSALFTLLFWGLNVVHASVEAHLKTFNVSPDLSLRLRGGHSETAGTNGLSLVLTFK